MKSGAITAPQLTKSFVVSAVRGRFTDTEHTLDSLRKMNDHPGKHRFRPTVFLLYGGAAAILIAIHLATNSVLGFHTDELYYMASGRHPAFGYVDFPPVVPL